MSQEKRVSANAVPFCEFCFEQGLYIYPGGGGATCIFWLDIILVKGLSKHTLNTYVSGMKIDPKYVFFACIFLNLCVMSFPKFVNMAKNIPFFPISHVFAPLNYVRPYTTWSWKTTLIMWFFFTGMISNFKYKWPPGIYLYINKAPLLASPSKNTEVHLMR